MAMSKKERLAHLKKPGGNPNEVFDRYIARQEFRWEIEEFIIDVFAKHNYRIFSEKFLQNLVQRVIDTDMEQEELEKNLIEKVINKK